MTRLTEPRRVLLVGVGAGEVSGYSINGGHREVWRERTSHDTQVVTSRVLALAADGLIERAADAAGSQARWGWQLTPAGRRALRTGTYEPVARPKKEPARPPRAAG